MNYGKKMTSKKRNSLISSSSMMGKRAHVSFIRVLFISLIALCVICVCLGLGAFKGVIDNAPDVEDVDIMPLGYASFLYDDQGNQLRKLAAPDSNRLPVSIEQIPVDLQHAVVAIEDERFYEHNGIDVKGILRAFVRNITSRDLSEGASTITQQLLKNNVFTNWTQESTWLERFTRKFQEQYLAIQIEEKINDKNVILENYLNTINLGAGAYGVQAAARQYFNKDVWDLNLSECATLAGITQNPSRFNPIENPKDNAKRKKEVLQHMLDQDYITQEQYETALNDDVYSRIQAAQEATSSSSQVYTYFEDELTDQVISDLMNIKGYTRTQARNMLYSGGLKIYTTQDPLIQSIMDEEYANPDNYPSIVQYLLDFALTVEDAEGNEVNYSKEMLTLYFRNEDPEFDLLFDSPEEGQTYVDRYKENILAGGGKVIAERVSFAPQPQSSMSVIDQYTGYVKGIVGGRGEKTASLTLNRATDSTRQPGSTFKIVSTYAPALNEMGMTLATTYDDEEGYTYPDGSPVNNASRTYNGTTTIRTAIRNSVNVVAVKCLADVTPELGLKYLDNFGFTTLAHGTEADRDENGAVWSDAQLPTALGGISKGVTNVELCASYAAIANGGNYIKPIYYTKILDHNGNVLIDNTPVERSVIKESTAWLLTNAMEDVVKYGTGTACQLDNMSVAGKTGTTEAYNDLWFVGYTPYYTCAVWSGYDDNEKLPDYARDFHKNLWKRVMSRIHDGLEYMEFPQPSSVEKASICEETGLLPRAGCPVITEYFDIGSMPTDYCDQHFYEVEEETYDSENPELTPTPSPDDPNGTGDNGDGTTGDGNPDNGDGNPDNSDGGNGDGAGGDGDYDGDGTGGDGGYDGDGTGGYDGDGTGGGDGDGWTEEPGEWDEETGQYYYYY